MGSSTIKRIWLLLMLGGRAFAATGDISGGWAETNGWQTRILFSGMATNGTYQMGWATNADSNWSTNLGITGTERLTITLSSPGLTDSGGTNVINRTLIGTLPVRHAFPDQAYLNEDVVGSDLVPRFALTDYIHVGDASIKATISPGLLVSGGVSNASAINIALTNQSQLPYFRTVANWTWPGFSAITGSVLRVKAFGYHSSGTESRPIRAMMFTASDGSTSLTNIVRNPEPDPNSADALPQAEYTAEFSTAQWAQGAIITVNFKAIPWMGDLTSILNTGDGVNASPTPLYAPQYFVNDPAGNYGRAHTVVDPSGNDASGQVMTDAQWATNKNPAPFATLNGAANAVYLLHSSTYGRANVGGGFAHLKAGSHAWLGGSSSYGSTPSAWFTIDAYPGLTPDQVIVGPVVSGNKDITDYVRISGVTITNTGSGSMFLGIDRLWFDRCILEMESTAAISSCKVVYVTDCEIRRMVQGLRPFSTHNTAFALVRGNRIHGGAVPNHQGVYTFVGNLQVDAASQFYVTDYSPSTGIPARDNIIIYGNGLYGFTNTSTFLLKLNGNSSISHGAAVVQNILEGITAASGQKDLLWIGADESGGTTTTTNVMVDYNTIVGERTSVAYAEPFDSARVGVRLRNNVFDDLNIKSDTFVDPDEGASGLRTNNWSAVYGVGWSGNVEALTTNASKAGSQSETRNAFSGARSIRPYGVSESPFHPDAWSGFVDRRATGQNGAGTGHGDYHLLDTSPMAGFAPHCLLPFDIEGNRRVATNDNVGAYARPRLNYQWPDYSFRDQYETGDDYTWQTRVADQSSYSVQTNRAYSGKWSIRYTIPAGAVSRRTYHQANWREKRTNDPVYLRARFWFNPTSNIATNQTVEILGFGKYQIGNTERLMLKRNATGNYVFRSSGLATDTSRTYSLGQWHTVEGRYKSGAGTGDLTWWINGEQVLQGANRTLTNCNMVAVGVLAYVSGVSYPNSTLEFWVDDVEAGPLPIPDGRLVVNAPELRGRIGAPILSVLGGLNTGDRLQLDLVTPTSTNTLTNLVAPISHTYRANLRGLATNRYTLRSTLIDSTGSIRNREDTTWLKDYAGDPRGSIDEWNSFCISNTPTFLLGNFIDWQDRNVEWIQTNAINVIYGGDSNDKTPAGMTVVLNNSGALGVMGFAGLPLPAFGGQGGATNLVDTNMVSYWTTNLMANTNVFGWAWMDEPTLYFYTPPQHRDWWLTTKSLDPRPVHMNQLGDNLAVDTEDRVNRGHSWAFPWLVSDAVGGDTYPYHYTNAVPGVPQIQEWGDRFDRMRRWNLDMLPVSAYVQAFDIWTNILGGPPTTNQVQHMVWVSVAAGASMIQWFGYHVGVDYWDPGYFANVSYTGTRVKALSRAIAAPPLDGFWQDRDRVTRSGDIYAKATAYLGTNWIFAANNSENGTETVTFYGPWQSGEAIRNWDTGQTLSAGSGQFTDTIGVNEWRIYSHTSGQTAPPPTGRTLRATNLRFNLLTH